MPATAGTSYTRVTVVAPTRRFDLALPNEVAFADLLPALLRYAGESPLDGALDGWTLQRLGQGPFENDQAPVAYGLRDGELLFLEPRADAAPEIVFDDVAEAVARNASGESARWAPGTTRTFGVATAGALIAAAALFCLFAGPALIWSWIAGGLALLLLAAGIVLSRALGESGTGALLAFASLPYAFVAGLFAPGEVAELTGLGTPHLLSAFTTVAFAAMVAMFGVSDAVHLFLGTAAAGTLGAIGALVVATGEVAPAAAAALVAAVATTLTPLLPTTSLRLAQVPLPHIPPDPDDIRHDDQPAYDAALLGQAHAADQFLTGLVSATALVVVVCDVLLLANGGIWGGVLVTVMSLSLLLRARHLPARGQRLSLLLAGLGGLMGVATAIFMATGLTGRILVLTAGLLAGTVSLLVGLLWPTAKRSPRWTSLAHTLEILLVVAIVPIALVVLGAYSWARALFG